MFPMEPQQLPLKPYTQAVRPIYVHNKSQRYNLDTCNLFMTIFATGGRGNLPFYRPKFTCEFAVIHRWCWNCPKRFLFDARQIRATFHTLYEKAMLCVFDSTVKLSRNPAPRVGLEFSVHKRLRNAHPVDYLRDPSAFLRELVAAHLSAV